MATDRMQGRRHPAINMAQMGRKHHAINLWNPKLKEIHFAKPVDIAEFEVEGGLDVGWAYVARRGVVLPSHSPQFLALSEGHLQPTVAAGYGAFDLDPSGHLPNVTTIAQGGGSGMREER